MRKSQREKFEMCAHGSCEFILFFLILRSLCSSNTTLILASSSAENALGPLRKLLVMKSVCFVLDPHSPVSQLKAVNHVPHFIIEASYGYLSMKWRNTQRVIPKTSYTIPNVRKVPAIMIDNGPP